MMLPNLYAQMMLTLEPFHADVRMEVEQAIHETVGRMIGHWDDAVTRLAVLCWQHNIPTAAISAYLKTIDPANDQLEQFVDSLNTIDQVRLMLFQKLSKPSPANQGLAARKSHQITVSMWYMSRAAISTLMDDGCDNDHMRRAMLELCDLGYTFPNNI